MSIILLSFLPPRFYLAFVLLSYYSACFKAEPLENTAQDSQMVLLDGVSDSKMARECGVGKLFQNYRPDRKNINVVGPVYCDSDMTGDADDRKLVSIYYSHIWRVLLFISFMNGSGI